MLALREFFWDWGAVAATSSGVTSTGVVPPSTGPVTVYLAETFFNVLGGNYRAWMKVKSSRGDIVSQVVSSKFHVQNVRTTHYTTSTPIININITP